VSQHHWWTRRPYRIGDRFRDGDGRDWVLIRTELVDIPFPGRPDINQRTATLRADDGGELHLPLHQLASNGLQLIE
jgi:hypothetical protein